jgi:hypothetical protein
MSSCMEIFGKLDVICLLMQYNMMLLWDWSIPVANSCREVEFKGNGVIKSVSSAWQHGFCWLLLARCFNVCHVGFWSCFGLIPTHPFFPFGTRIFTLCHYVLEVCNFLFWKYVIFCLILQGLTGRVCPESQRRDWTCTFQEC